MEKTKFWIATEVNNTAAHTRKTLYVAGKQALSDVLRHTSTNGISHVSFGTGGELDLSDGHLLETVDALVAAGYTVTIEYNIGQHADVENYLGTTLFNSRSLIPLAVLGDINISSSNPNFTLVINDCNADGRWCVGPSAIMDSNRFTLNAEYDPSLSISLDKPPVTQTHATPAPIVSAPVAEPVATPELAPEYPEVTPTPVVDTAEAVAADVTTSEPDPAPEQESTDAEPAADQTATKRGKRGANAD